MPFVHTDRPNAIDPSSVTNMQQILDEAARGFSPEAIEQCRLAIDVAAENANDPYDISLLLYDLLKVFVDNVPPPATN